ncbi:MAG: hypothetical protein U0412_08350 [Nitrospira sp.]
MSNRSSIRVVSIDDHPVVRAGVREHLARAKDLRIVSEGGSVVKTLTLTTALYARGQRQEMLTGRVCI